jgi:peptidoglycan/xylan/chitin deacetylase (PgdA/CDA1 family)
MHGRVTLKRRIGRLYSLFNACDAHRKLVLLYHSVGGGPDATTADKFHDHLKVITSAGSVVSLRSIVEACPDRGLAVAITFDDGYATLHDRASAILQEFGCAATVFLNAGEIADDTRRSSRVEDGYYPAEQFLTWRDVDALRTAGWHFGSHGVRHLNLVTADVETAKNELSASKLMIERRLGTECDMFAYTWGRNNSILRAEVRAAGYKYGFSGHHSPVTAESDPFCLPRINVANEYAPDDLAAILRGDWDYLHWLARAKAVMG